MMPGERDSNNQSAYAYCFLGANKIVKKSDCGVLKCFWCYFWGETKGKIVMAMKLLLRAEGMYKVSDRQFVYEE